jgi:hypothetical protein
MARGLLRSIERGVLDAEQLRARLNSILHIAAAVAFWM